MYDTSSVREIIVGTEGLPEDDAALAYLRTMLAADRVRLRLVHVITVPMTVPLDVPMPEADARASAILERGKRMAEGYGIAVETAVLRGRAAGEALVEEARRTRADALLIRFRSRPAPLGHFIVGTTVSTLLRTAPCPVLIFHAPHGGALRRAREAEQTALDAWP